MRLVSLRQAIWILPSLAIFAGGFLSGYHFAPAADTNEPNPIRPANSKQVKKEPQIADRQVDSGLGDQLLLANQEISQLEARNLALSRQIEQMNLPISSNTTYPELLARVDRLPGSLIRKQLRTLFDEDFVDTIDDPHDFAKELIEVALDTESEETNDSLQIAFSLSPTWGLRNFSYLDTIDEYDQVFAHFVAAQNFPNLIVRWQHRDTGEILKFGPLQLIDNQSRYQSLKPSQGWETGSYQVSVYNLDNEKQMIGSRLFQISGVEEQAGESAGKQPDLDVINDLLSSGAASAKSF
ncbi:MAG: hypothetical protein AAF353_08880 [Pseudomonadota bacterium]